MTEEIREVPRMSDPPFLSYMCIEYCHLLVPSAPGTENYCTHPKFGSRYIEDDYDDSPEVSPPRWCPLREEEHTITIRLEE